MASCKQKGCTDPLADNYSASAEKDNGTCKYITNPWAPNNPNNPNPGGGNPGTNQTIEWTTNITTPTTVPANTLVKVCTDINVLSDLVLQEGVIIEFCANKSLTIEANGSISANGSVSKNVIFKGSVNTAGFWGGIAINSNNPSNVMNHVQVLNGGNGYYQKYSNIYLAANAQLRISNSTISGSEEYGLKAAETSKLIDFQNNVFKDNGKQGLSISSDLLNSLDQASNYNLNNTLPSIQINGGTILNASTIKNLNTYYLVSLDLTIHAATTIVPGTRFKFEAQKGITVAQNGSINATGTSSERIILEGASHGSGFWDGLRISSNNPQNILNYVTITDAGFDYYHKYSGIFLEGSMSIDNSIISNSNSWGIYVDGGTTIKTNGSVQTTVAGITANNTLSGNGVGGNATCTNGCMVRFP